MKKDLQLTRSVKGTAVSNITWDYVQNRKDQLKIKAVTYVHDTEPSVSLQLRKSKHGDTHS